HDAPVDDEIVLVRSPRWVFVCCYAPPHSGAACPRRSRALFLAPSRSKFFCRRCANLAYASQRSRPASRLRPFAVELAGFERALASPDRSAQLAAIRGTRRVLQGLIGKDKGSEECAG